MASVLSGFQYLYDRLPAELHIRGSDPAKHVVAGFRFESIYQQHHNLHFTCFDPKGDAIKHSSSVKYAPRHVLLRWLAAALVLVQPELCCRSYTKLLQLITDYWEEIPELSHDQPRQNPAQIELDKLRWLRQLVSIPDEFRSNPLVVPLRSQASERYFVRHADAAGLTPPGVFLLQVLLDQLFPEQPSLQRIQNMRYKFNAVVNDSKVAL